MLVSAERPRHHDLDLGKKVAPATARVGQAPSSEAQAGATRRPCFHSYFGLTLRGADSDGGTEGGLPRREREVHVKVPSVQPVAGVGGKVHDQV